ncbi:MAG: RteB two-component response regulator [Bacteroidetes bacterium]|nr:RteB two-component response regulator [Bacteroidota bacterium]
MNQSILIIEDDFTFGEILKKWFQKSGYKPLLTRTMNQAKEIVNNNKKIDLVLTDLRLPDGDGILFLAWLRDKKIATPLMVMTSYAEISTAVAAMKLGAFDYLEKPFQPEILRQKIEQALASGTSLKPVVEASQNTAETRTRKVDYSKSPLMQKVYEEIEVVAPTRMSVLLMGESGTGKEYAARMVHERSKRSEYPFIAVDCGILSKELAPSELFGHVKGAFTSADGNKKGVFEQADGGTVFLDEIENLLPDVQAQLLRALQERKVRPVGSASDTPVDVRIVAATNENLSRLIGEGRFREDLYHRINEFEIHLPPLRERAEDIPTYAAYFLQEANKELEQCVPGFSTEAMEMLANYHWSGNLRELRNVVRRAALFAKDQEIAPKILPDYLCTPLEKDQFAIGETDEKEQIKTILRIVKGNKAAAARLLKMSRKTLYNKMHEYGIEI